MNAIKQLFIVNPLMVIFFLALIVGLTFGLALLRGNSFAMLVALKLGFPTLSGIMDKDFKFVRRFNKDVMGVIKVPNTTYNVVCKSDGVSYTKKDFLGRETKKGELRLLSIPTKDGMVSDDNSLIPDMSLIDGNGFVTSNSMQSSAFSRLRGYVKTDVKFVNDGILLYDGIKVEHYYVICAVESIIYDNHKLSFDSKQAFVSKMRQLAFYKSDDVHTAKVVVLRVKTDIDVMMVVLGKKVG